MSASAKRPTVPSPSNLDEAGVCLVANDNGVSRSSTRPTVPIGPPLVMILSEPFADITPLALPRF